MDDEKVKNLAAQISGVQVKEEETSQEVPVRVDGKVKIFLSEDKMKAFAIVTPPLGEGKAIDAVDIMTALTESGVKYGISDEAVQRVAAEASAEKVLIAEGQTPENGKDAEIEYLFEEKDVKGGPQILEDGSVDLRSVVILSDVQEGDKLAVKTPSTFGEPGMRITGEKVPPVPGHDKSLLVGKGAYLSEDEMTVFAENAGRPILVNRRVKVDPVYVVKGNVDYHSGNVDFSGSVVIREWVRDGFTVRATGDIEVHGGVDAATLDAGGKIVIRYGVQGAGKAFLKAGEDIVASYLVNTEIRAGRDVVARENIMHCKVHAGRHVRAQGGKGLIVGGMIKAADQVNAKIIGNRLATPTMIDVGENPNIKIEWDELEKQAKQRKETLEQVAKATTVLLTMKKSGKQLPLDKEIALKKFLMTKEQIEEELADIKGKQEELEDTLEEVRMPMVKALGQIYPGVKVTIRGVTLFVRDPLERVSLSERDREILVGEY